MTTTGSGFQGTWRGHYRYDHAEADRIFGAVGFMLVIHEDANGRFHGIVTDDVEAGGTPGEGTISGRRRGPRLRWTKLMPHLTLSDGEGRQYVMPDRPHYPLAYSGEIDGTARRASGRWRFKGLRGLFSVKGTWTTERVD
ncbi:MAG: hypothetical protein R3F20_05460 [Planctomycetota bacterium]